MAISYLEGTTQIEIRPASSDRNDVLFEMVTSEFTNICCRVDTFYDLVVRDIDSGTILFCINGAEIEDHPVEVYAEEPIGKIENGKIYLVGSGSNDVGSSSIAVQIEGTESQYNINTSLVRVTTGLVKLDWPHNVSNEMKVMTIAFALNISLTKYKLAMVGGASTNRRHFQHDLYGHLSTLPSTFEISPRQNVPKIPSVFAPSNVDQLFWLATVRRDPKNLQRTTFVMDANRNVLLLVKSLPVDKTNAYTTIVQKINGIEEFKADIFVRETDKFVLSDVYCCGKEIGRIEYNTKRKMHTLTHRTATGNEAVLTSSVINREHTQIDFTDSNGLVHGGMNKQFYTALKIQLLADTSPTMKKLILCTAIQFFGGYLKNFDRCPHVAIKSLKCNCSQCLQLLHKSEPYHLKSVYRLFNENNLQFKTAGHNRKKNVTYFDVSRRSGGRVLCTLEVTPIKDFTGVAKVVCKTRNGCTMFTSLKSLANYFTLIYNSGNALIGYITENMVISSEMKPVLIFREKRKRQEYDESLFGPNINCNLFRESGQRISAISSSFCCVTLHRPSDAKVKLTQLELSAELTLAALFHSDPYGFDKIPTPEIAYFYGTED